ncbi:Uncharacterized protein Fot_32234 [Forsythia ovata]|uniref:Uncharacterized protein n=1 Tax=Forsythia ovata TaxID=205694 RepID=A0ABD1T773_9LAMI
MPMRDDLRYSFLGLSMFSLKIRELRDILMNSRCQTFTLATIRDKGEKIEDDTLLSVYDIPPKLHERDLIDTTYVLESNLPFLKTQIFDDLGGYIIYNSMLVHGGKSLN